MSPRIQRAAAWVIALLVAGALLGYVRHEGQVREDQFCDLIVDRHVGEHKRIAQTEEFLASPDRNRPELKGLADYIEAIALPRDIKEFAAERRRIPPVCHDEVQDAIDSGKLERLR